MRDVISIITPTYNHEKYIEECIRSVLKQDYQNWEMIIVDDASTDNTVKVIEKYEREDSRIKLIIHEENYGPYRLVDTYNEALRKSKGKYISILEGDDIMPKNKMNIQVSAFDKVEKDYILVYGNCLVVNEKLRPMAYYKPPINRKIAYNDPIGSALYYLLKLEIHINPQSVLIKKSALKKIGGFKGSDYLHLVDYPTLLHLSLVGRFYYIDETLGIWRRHLSSVTSNYDRDLSTLEDLSRYFIEFVKNNKRTISNLGIKFSEDEISNVHAKIINYKKDIQRYFNATFLLSLNKFKDAKKSFYNVLKMDNIPKRYKFGAIIGIISCYLKIDLISMQRMLRSKILHSRWFE